MHAPWNKELHVAPFKPFASSVDYNDFITITLNSWWNARFTPQCIVFIYCKRQQNKNKNKNECEMTIIKKQKYPL